MRRLLYTAAMTAAVAAPLMAQNKREDKVRADKATVEAAGYWLYNDLPRAFAEAKATGKPILAVLRCIPCEECVKLDDDLVNTDPALRPLLDKFVRVRVVSTNGLDLSLFQFDTDQSFAAFLLNADGTVYGRFGTRSHRTNWVGDVSIQGLAKALEGALDLHARFPETKPSLAGKRGPAPEFATPERLPTLKGKYTAKLDYAGKVVPSCIHCHQIGDAIKEHHRTRDGLLPDDVLFPYPHPTAVGLTLDPKELATVTAVAAGSWAADAGFKPGDAIRTLAGQPLLSMADVQWVLHRTSADGGTVPAEVVRNGKPVAVALAMPAGWKRAGDLSWRASAWGLRRMATGGMLLETPDAGPGLRVKHVGQYGPHAAAKQAGFREGDMIVGYDGREFRRETDLLAYSLTTRKPGETVVVKVLRDGKQLELKLPMQR